ncbi:MAG: endonuclease III [Thermomicrobium sp.]|nr:endonuclease III [Thermomicrobium sp.]MDW8058836.1 endonuclease III [Thermomicrobium sp.]
MTSESATFDIDEAIRRLREAVRRFPPAALFQLAAEGYRSPFELLVACLVSVRTRDEVTVAVARRLLERVRTPAELATLDAEELLALLRPATFAETKARNLHAIAERLARERVEQRLCEETFLLQLPGVGPKCANLVLGIACGIPRVAVDVHVHRITNRWGYVRTRTPEQTMRELERKLPREYWVELNRLLVPFGKHVCTGTLPRCSQCVLADLCPRIGVARHR